MSDLKQQLSADMKSAMKAGDKPKLGVIRLVNAAIKQREVDERIELGDAEIVAVLDKMAKQRRESVEQYLSAQRNDLADKETFELSVIQEYLPAALDDSEIDALISDAIAQSGASGMKDMGKVMGLLKPKLQGRADMGAVSAKIKGTLGA